MMAGRDSKNNGVRAADRLKARFMADPDNRKAQARAWFEQLRDRIMTALHEEFPGYGWLKNKGYATEVHLEALARLGPTSHHRRSFSPVHNILYGHKSGDSTADSIVTL